MAHLVIISETGMFHSACLFDYSAEKRQWYGFHPKQHGRPAGQGEVDLLDRRAFINHYIRFDVTEAGLNAAERMIMSKYSNATYGLGVQDCVSLSADVARECGLGVPLVNFTPYGLIQVLRLHNSYTHYDVWPLPF